MIKELEIKVICDNNSIIGEDYGNSGFSLLLNCTDNKGIITKYLFDTGVDPKIFEQNTKKLELDLKNIKNIIISHGHFDHTGGLTYAINNCNNELNLYSHKDSFIDKVLFPELENEMLVGFNAKNNIDILSKVKLHTNIDYTEISDNIYLSGIVNKESKYENITGHLEHVIKKEDTKNIKDTIIEDQSLIITLSNNKSILICGCCHAGIINTINHWKEKIHNLEIYSIIGGLQLHQASEEQLKYTIEKLKDLNIGEIYPLHSSGEKGFGVISKELGFKCKKGGVGTIIKYK